MYTQNALEEREIFTTAYSKNHNRIDHLEIEEYFWRITLKHVPRKCTRIEFI
jgi:hypothetical protein